MKSKKRFKSGYVAFLGKPNVGKSTLMNFFLKQKLAIVTDKPQTTRNIIQGIYTDKDAQIIFLDTPGMHKPRTRLGNCMMKSAVFAGADADVVFFMVDAVTGITKADQHIYKTIKDKNILKKCKWSALLINKADTIKKKQLLPLMKQCASFTGFSEYIPVSALKGDSCLDLLKKIKEVLPCGPAYYPADQLTDKNERFVVAELIRESALKICREEIPHSVAVEVQEFKDNEDSNRKTFIQAVIFIERDAQKKIVIGKNASMLKQIGFFARKEIESFLNRNVYLELKVKVHKNWRKDGNFLRRIGYDKDF